MTTAEVEVTKLRLQFFDFLFGNEQGYLCIAVGNSDKTWFKQDWFKWPNERLELGQHIEKYAGKYNVWYGISLFNKHERKRVNAVPGTRVWSDLDEVDPFELDPLPSIIIESSPGKYQGIWSFSNAFPTDIAQDYSKRLAYTVGADKSGWDIEQLLRVPWTKNFKYNPPREVKLLQIAGLYEHVEIFDKFPQVSDTGGAVIIDDKVADVPVLADLPNSDQIIELYRREITNPMESFQAPFVDLLTQEPGEGEDWSARLWRLINICMEIGMSPTETFVIAADARCNKYARDNRPISHLWKEIQKAATRQYQSGGAINNFGKLQMPIMVDPDSFVEESFVADYKKWANEATDAPEQYHELGAFMALSSVISQGLALELPYNDNFRPNLWGLVLGESTLSRKTTSMRMVMDLITDLDNELILATEGSAEGLMQGLSGRPKRVSIFYKDEVSGFFDSINRKDYLAGFPETLTQLYDVPRILSRILRKETITVAEPYFLFFGGGIRDKVYSLINEDYILSGFIPRFLIVSSDNDVKRLRRTGPPTNVSSDKKNRLITHLADLKDKYSIQVQAQVGSQTIQLDGRITAYLTPDAWDFFGDLEESVPLSGVDTPWEMLALPTLTRLTFSVLKMAMLVAASRRDPSSSNKLEVTKNDLQQAAGYVQRWGQHSLDLIMSAGKSRSEKMIDKVMMYIRQHHEGVTQTQIMQRYHLSSRDMRDLRDTLYDRGYIDVDKKGRGMIMKAVRF